jgi:hypothetical protein
MILDGKKEVIPSLLEAIQGSFSLKVLEVLSTRQNVQRGDDDR